MSASQDRRLAVQAEQDKHRIKALYLRLKGRKGMNERNALTMRSDAGEAAALGRADAYQNAINDLCAAFGVTVEELERL